MINIYELDRKAGVFIKLLGDTISCFFGIICNSLINFGLMLLGIMIILQAFGVDLFKF